MVFKFVPMKISLSLHSTIPQFPNRTTLLMDTLNTNDKLLNVANEHR